jgi:hypothetical protein
MRCENLANTNIVAHAPSCENISFEFTCGATKVGITTSSNQKNC